VKITFSVGYHADNFLNNFTYFTQCLLILKIVIRYKMADREKKEK